MSAMVKETKAPKFGTTRWEVEWCDELAFGQALKPLGNTFGKDWCRCGC
jgi:hypothetical protein